MSLIGGLIVLMCGFLISRGDPPADAYFFLLVGIFFMCKDYIIAKK